jgi:glucose-6-phosphate isomerase
MVGHYWLRAPELRPHPADRGRSADARGASSRSRQGPRRPGAAPPTAGRFRHLLVVGIGGSALGPQLVADALGGPLRPDAPHFLDNTDPDGIDRVLGASASASPRPWRS